MYLYLDIPFPTFRHEILAHVDLWDHGPAIQPRGLDAVGPPQLNTLDDFRHFWDAAVRAQVIVINEFSEFLYLVANGEVKEQLRWQPAPRPQQGRSRGEGVSLYFERRGVGRIAGEECWEGVDKLFLAVWWPKFNVFFSSKVPTNKNQLEPQILVLPANYRDQQPPRIYAYGWLSTFTFLLQR